MSSDLNGFEIPYIINAPKSVEEKIEEARRSGYINSNNPNDINSNREQLCCRACGSLKVSPGTPIYLDDTKGVEIPYLCLNCGYVGTRAACIRNLVPADDGGDCLVVDLIPDGLVGIAGTLINND